jgi:hypothetical protein
MNIYSTIRYPIDVVDNVHNVAGFTMLSTIAPSRTRSVHAHIGYPISNCMGRKAIRSDNGVISMRIDSECLHLCLHLSIALLSARSALIQVAQDDVPAVFTSSSGQLHSFALKSRQQKTLGCTHKHVFTSI